MRQNTLLWVFLLPFLSINYSASVFPANGYLLGNECSMLLLLKNNLIFNPTISKKLTLWNQNEDCCQWHGVTCKEGRVVALDLSEESISGGIRNSTVLFRLQYIRSLNLAFNNFSSVIPSELCKLNNLRYLNFSNAGFEGQIPHEMFHLRRLVTLDLSSSISSPHSLKLDKPNIAMLLQNLTEITELYLDGIAIFVKGQEWFHALSSLHNLRVLSMSSCNMSGPIHASLAKLVSLTVLKLSYSNMFSFVPDSLTNLSNLVILQLRSCGLNGSFPKDIFLMPSLEVLDISDNQHLMGSLPNFQPRGSLRDLNISQTSFTGNVPDAISKLKLLSTIDLSYCQFNGTLPSSMSELSQLVYLDLSSNNFSGPLPSFNMSKNLTHLSLHHNNLTGVLPSSHFEGLKNLADIYLGFNFFKGNLPSSLLKLPYLRELKLPFNQLTGPLDESVMTSPTLEMLDLGGNNLEGPIPLSIFNLRTLGVIQLNSNKFNGTLQLDLIRRLSNLTTLGLSHNNLSVDIYSTYDRDLLAFPALRKIMLASCKLRGIPAFVKSQSTLLHLDLADNEIQGTIPYWIWQLKYLVILNLSKNFLTKLEGNVWNFSSNLLRLDLSSNQLQGPFPFLPTFVNILDYSNNRFNSVIPADIGNRLPFVTQLSLSNNSFQGQIPESFLNASSLLLLDLSRNNFVGTIPKFFAELSSTLRVLNFGGNKLQGYIPDTLPTSCTLHLLDLNDNLLEGTIPTSLAYCQKLQVLDLGRNLLTDKFPCFLSKISTLRIMDLRLNKLHGSVGCPKNSGDWEMLHIVDVASNNFSGAIPKAVLNSWKAMRRDNDNVGPEFGHLFIDIIDNYDPKNFKDLWGQLDKTIKAKFSKIVDQSSSDFLQVDISQYQNSILITNKGRQIKLDKIQRAFTYVDMSSKYFEGPIPIELMQFKAMMALDLSNNALSGHIPSSIENLKNLESLDMSNNSLSGEIPRELASLNFLAYLNLSNNDLVGEIPKGTQIQTFDGDSFEGNEKLCGPPLTRNCSNIGMPTPETPQSHSKSSIDWSLLSAELGFIFGFGVFILPLLFWKRWSFWYSKHVDEMLHKIIPQLDFSYEHRRGQTRRTLRRRY
ncbi:receptor-like protein 7 [Vigna unguiculata]|uniref:receptor-like protein 7 n=1 Tax=Vigna unguiculata TaxID=3917 RepID=UPI001016349B|nr:receptor-like protein 7 [Vigna unguiculata]